MKKIFSLIGTIGILFVLGFVISCSCKSAAAGTPAPQQETAVTVETKPAVEQPAAEKAGWKSGDTGPNEEASSTTLMEMSFMKHSRRKA